MADRSSIEWTDSTWNCLRGCSRTIAAGAETSGCGDPTGDRVKVLVDEAYRTGRMGNLALESGEAADVEDAEFTP